MLQGLIKSGHGHNHPLRTVQEISGQLEPMDSLSKLLNCTLANTYSLLHFAPGCNQKDRLQLSMTETELESWKLVSLYISTDLQSPFEMDVASRAHYSQWYLHLLIVLILVDYSFGAVIKGYYLISCKDQCIDFYLQIARVVIVLISSFFPKSVEVRTVK